MRGRSRPCAKQSRSHDICFPAHITPLIFLRILKTVHDQQAKVTWDQQYYYNLAQEKWKCCHFDLSGNTLSLPSRLLPKRGRGCQMSPICLESQGCHLILLYCLLSWSSAYSHCSLCLLFFFFSCLLAHSPDGFPQKILLFFFFYCVKRVSLLLLLVWLLFSSWEMTIGRWYVQHAAVWHLHIAFLRLHNIKKLFSIHSFNIKY